MRGGCVGYVKGVGAAGRRGAAAPVVVRYCPETGA